jgi:hypothetical protein
MGISWVKAWAVAGLMTGSGLVLAANDGQTQVNGLLGSDAEYLSTWQQVVQSEERLPDWVINLSGYSAQHMTAVEEDGHRYLVGPLCESAESCARQRLVVAFSWDKDSAYAMLVEVPEKLPADTTPRESRYHWLGKPDKGMQALLKEKL